MGKKIGQALKRSIEMDSLMTPGMPGYKMPKQSLYDRLFKKRRATLDPLDLDKEEFPEAHAATNLDNYAINEIFEDMSDASSVSSDHLLPEAPPMPEMYKGFPISIPPEAENHVFMGNRDDFSTGWYSKGEPIENFGDGLGATSMEMLANRVESDRHFPTEIGSPMHNFNTPDLSNMTDQELQTNLSKFYLPTSGTRPELFKRLVDAKEDPAIMQRAADNATLPKVQQGALARLSRQNNQAEPYPDNWNSQANTNANRSWGAQNLANRQAEIAQSGSNVAGLGGRGVQAAENTLPQAVARAGGVSSFASRALPVISLGLFASSLYSNAKANRDNERQKKMIEGNQI